MAMRFVPPPGWRTPAGFTPSDDWHPDPSWPAAPDGWVFWTDDAVPPGPPAAVPAGPEQTPTRRSLRQGHPVTATTVPDPVRVREVPDAHPVVGSTMVLPALVGAGAPSADGRVPRPAPRSHVVRLGATPGSGTPAAPAQPVGPLSLPGADEDTEDHGRARRWIVPAAFGVAGVATGLLVGIGLTLTAQGDAREATADAERVQSEVAAEREQLESERADLEAQQEDLEVADGALADREKAVEQSETDAEARSADLDEREAQQQRDQEQRDQEQRDQERRDRQNGGPGQQDGNGQGGGQGDGQDDGQDDGAWWDWTG